MLGHDAVEDELGDVEDQHWQACPDEAQREARLQEARARGMNEAEQGRQVAQGAEALGRDPAQARQSGKAAGEHRGDHGADARGRRSRRHRVPVAGPCDLGGMAVDGHLDIAPESASLC